MTAITPGRDSLATWLSRLETRHHQTIQLGLDRVVQVRDRLGLATPSCPVITVGGTNGKGSVCAYLGTILVMAGLKTGVYTSPHLLRFNERIVIDGRPVADAELVEALEQVEAARGDIHLTYFEHTTLAAFWLFSRAGLDVMVLEVGLGGRLDAVNALDPDCAVVTSIGLDHQEYLGDTREAIGYEKAGIYRPDTPALCLDPEPPESLLAHARQIGARLFLVGRDIRYRLTDATWECRVGDAVMPALPLPALKGRHQLANAAGALAALRLLHDRLPVPLAAIRAGLAAATVPGRFQVVGQQPLRILDVAHNPHAAQALAEVLADRPPLGRTLAVFAMYADKDVAGVVRSLKSRVDFWHVAPLEGPRGAGVDALAAVLEGEGCDFRRHPHVTAAWQEACNMAGPADTIIAFGSFMTVAEILATLQRG